MLGCRRTIGVLQNPVSLYIYIYTTYSYNCEDSDDCQQLCAEAWQQNVKIWDVASQTCLQATLCSCGMLWFCKEQARSPIHSVLCSNHFKKMQNRCNLSLPLVMLSFCPDASGDMSMWSSEKKRYCCYLRGMTCHTKATCLRGDVKVLVQMPLCQA